MISAVLANQGKRTELLTVVVLGFLMTCWREAELMGLISQLTATKFTLIGLSAGLALGIAAASAVHTALVIEKRK